MITYTFNTVTRLLLIVAPLIIVSGCTTIADPGNSASQAAVNIQAEPGPERLVRYCRRMAETKNLRIAIGICERALAAAPENPEPVIILAEAYLEAEHRAEAAEAYRFALTIDDQSGQAHFGLGKLYLRDSQLEEARSHLEAALRSGEQDPAIFNALGVLEDQSGDHTSAQAFYQAGLELDPGNSAIANNYGVSLLLSKPSEIGSNTFDQLPPAQDLNERSSPIEPRTVSSELAERRTLALRQPIKPVAPTVKKVVVSTISAQSLVQTPDETLLGFFMDSRSNGPDTMDPVITPAPVEIVDFQTLPNLPTPRVVQVKEDTLHGKLLARALLDYNPTQASIAATSERLTTLVSKETHRDGTSIKPSIDLATVIPGRNPFLQHKTRYALYTDTQSISDDAAPSASHPKVLIAEIPHLPIEMPGFNRTSQSNKQNTVTTSGDEPGESHAGIEVQADVLIFGVGSPLDALTPKDENISGNIATDGLLPTATTGLALLKHNGEIWKTNAPVTYGQVPVAVHHLETAAPNQSDFQGDANPELKDPEAEPLLWPNGIADRNLPLNTPPSPDRRKDKLLAMMLLNRSAFSAG